MATLASSGSLTATNPTSDVEPECCDLSEFDDNTVFVIDTIGMGGFVHDSSSSTSTFLPDSVALLELGGISIFAHTLSQLDGARRIVVLCREEKTQSQHLQESKSQTPAPLSRFRLESLVKDIDLNIDLTFVETTSSTEDISNRDAFFQTFNALSPFLKDDLNVVVVPLNCIFSTPILYRCAQHGVNLSISDSPSTNHRSRSSSISEPSAMAVVLEQDLEGMVGMPESWLKASYKPLDNSDGKGKVVATGSSLTSYGAIFTGLYVMTPRMITSTAIKVLSDPKLRQHFFKAHTFESVLSMLCSEQGLDRVMTKGNTWVSIVSSLAFHHAKSTLVKVGHTVQAGDGRELTLFGMPQSLNQRSAHTGGDWASFNVNKWRSAVFTTKAYFSELYEDTTTFVLQEVLDCKWHSKDRKPLLIEVGCGTGEALLPIATSHDSKVGFSLGIDINPKFIEFCLDQLSKAEINDRAAFVNEDACKLSTVLEKLFDNGTIPIEYKDAPKVVMCVGNTVGIMPAAVKDAVMEEMAKVAGSDGCAIVVYWNGNCFGDGCQNFYHKNPQLCGHFTGANVDFDECVLETDTGYRTHWSKPDEVQKDLVRRGFRVKRVLEKGKGVLAAFL